MLKILANNLFPALGKHKISELKTRDLLAPIKLVETSSRHEVAARLQQRATAVMRFAVQNGLLKYNPAQYMAGAIAVAKRVHRLALDFERFSELLDRIECFKGRKLTILAVILTLLVFIRSSELRFARWEEIDSKNALWMIPAEREPMKGVKYSHRGSKMRSPHLMPLSHQALEVLKDIKQISGDYELVFIGDHQPDRSMSENTLTRPCAQWATTPKRKFVAMVSALWHVVPRSNPAYGQKMQLNVRCAIRSVITSALLTSTLLNISMSGG